MMDHIYMSTCMRLYSCRLWHVSMYAAYYITGNKTALRRLWCTPDSIRLASTCVTRNIAGGAMPGLPPRVVCSMLGNKYFFIIIMLFSQRKKVWNQHTLFLSKIIIVIISAVATIGKFIFAGGNNNYRPKVAANFFF